MCSLEARTPPKNLEKVPLLNLESYILQAFAQRPCEGQVGLLSPAGFDESREMLGVMPLQVFPQPQEPCPDTSA